MKLISKLKRITTAAALLAIVFSFQLSNGTFAQQTSTQSTLLYKVSGNGLKKPSYLFGTFHILKSDYLQQYPAVKKALDKTNGTVVELKLDSTMEVKMGAAMQLESGTISTVLPESLKDSLNSYLKLELGAVLTSFNTLNPAGLNMFLTILQIMKYAEPKINQFGGVELDRYFANYASDKGKKVVELETIDEQLSIIYGSNLEQQVTDLRLFLQNEKQLVPLTNEMLDVYLKHDLDGLFALSEEIKKYSDPNNPIYSTIEKRNTKWMNQLPDLIKQEPYFIAVGALHLVGPEGLIEQLKQLGYEVTPIEL